MVDELVSPGTFIRLRLEMILVPCLLFLLLLCEPPRPFFLETKGCSDQGECVAGKCKCHATYGGDDCATRVCSTDGPGDCSGHGLCKTVPDSDAPLCVCSGSYHG